MKYRVVVTELHSAEYHVDAESSDEAHESVVKGHIENPIDHFCQWRSPQTYIEEIKE